MATDTLEDRAAHIRGLTVTTLAAVMGVVGALVTSVVAGSPTDTLAVYVVVGAVIVQFPVLQVLGVDVEDFSAKDYLYVAFMTFALWFICWAILLTNGAGL
ncbi:MAG: hypothetical protein ABEJ23_04105 [Haloarculaceae archaeon]